MKIFWRSSLAIFLLILSLAPLVSAGLSNYDLTSGNIEAHVYPSGEMQVSERYTFDSHMFFESADLRIPGELDVVSSAGGCIDFNCLYNVSAFGNATSISVYPRHLAIAYGGANGSEYLDYDRAVEKLGKKMADELRDELEERNFTPWKTYTIWFNYSVRGAIRQDGENSILVYPIRRDVPFQPHPLTISNPYENTMDMRGMIYWPNVTINVTFDGDAQGIDSVLMYWPKFSWGPDEKWLEAHTSGKQSMSIQSSDYAPLYLVAMIPNSWFEATLPKITSPDTAENVWMNFTKVKTAQMEAKAKASKGFDVKKMMSSTIFLLNLILIMNLVLAVRSILRKDKKIIAEDIVALILNVSLAFLSLLSIASEISANGIAIFLNNLTLLASQSASMALFAISAIYLYVKYAPRDLGLRASNVMAFSLGLLAVLFFITFMSSKTLLVIDWGAIFSDPIKEAPAAIQGEGRWGQAGSIILFALVSFAYAFDMQTRLFNRSNGAQKTMP